MRIDKTRCYGAVYGITPNAAAGTERPARWRIRGTATQGSGERGWKGAWTVAHQRIGETAGAIWQRLSQEGPQTLGVLMHEVNVPESLFFMAVGWLSREGKLEFEPTDGDYTVWLR